MEKLQGIRACVFDAYGTLFDVQGPMRKLAPDIGPDSEKISSLWRQKQLEYSWLRSLMGVHADFWHVTGDALDYALEHYNVSEPGLRDELLALFLKLDAYEEVADALAAVKAKSKMTAILSNGSPDMLAAAVEAIAAVPVALRDDPAIGLVGPAWMFAVVWSTDIAAYFAGRKIGGPKLMPRVSPNKTWSGFIAGLIGAMLAGYRDRQSLYGRQNHQR